MTAQLQPGTLVEFTFSGLDTTPAGSRAWIVEIKPTQGVCSSPCGVCGTLSAFGLILTIPVPLPYLSAWCPNHWRPIGGDFEEAKRTVEVGV